MLGPNVQPNNTGTPATSGAGLRKRRRTTFVIVPSETINDSSISFRARGVLGYLLDKPDGWDVRSEAIAADGPEGREAIRTALHELGKAGYYRLERRRLRDGTFAMGTAVSEDPVPQWVLDYAEFGGKAVPVIEQPGGTFKVKHKDGSLSSDGFEGVPAGQTGDGFLDSGDSATGDGFPGAGPPGAGPPDSGPRDAFNQTESPDTDTKNIPTSQPEAAVGNARAAPPSAGAGTRKSQTKPRTQPPPGVEDVLAVFDDQLRAGWDPDAPNRIGRAVAKELVHRTPAQLQARIRRRWDLWDRNAVIDSVAVAITLVRHGPCPEVMCEDGQVTTGDGPRSCSACPDLEPGDPPRPAPNSRPSWCGRCDERTRQIEVGDEQLPAPCPDCHPNRATVAA